VIHTTRPLKSLGTTRGRLTRRQTNAAATATRASTKPNQNSMRQLSFALFSLSSFLAPRPIDLPWPAFAGVLVMSWRGRMRGEVAREIVYNYYIVLSSRSPWSAS
jgi:hypothetical protein